MYACLDDIFNQRVLQNRNRQGLQRMADALTGHPCAASRQKPSLLEAS